MIPPRQREAISVLQELCALSDDIRLGQLMAHLGFLGEIATGRNLWDLDDEQLLSVMYQHLAELKARLPGGHLSALQPPAAATTTPAATPG